MIEKHGRKFASAAELRRFEALFPQETPSQFLHYSRVTELTDAVRELLNTINAMRDGHDDGPWFGPFGEVRTVSEGLIVEWPNLEISAERLHHAMHAMIHSLNQVSKP